MEPPAKLGDGYGLKTPGGSLDDWSKCRICQANVRGEPHVVVYDGWYAHDTCVDWAQRPFPGSSAAQEFRTLAGRFHRLAQNLDRAAARVEQLGQGWPRHGVARLRAYFELRSRAVAAMHRAVKEY
jgi:hypothetical protein